MKFQKLTSFFSRAKTTGSPSTRLAIDSAAEEIRTLKAKGNEFLDLGNLLEAIANYQVVVDLTPGDAGAYIALGFAQLEAEQFDFAKVSFVSALNIDSQSVDAHFLMGQLLVRQQLFKQAAKSFKSALAIKPDFDHAWFELARLQESARELEDALRSFGNAFAANPEMVDAAVAKLRIMLGLERWQEALDMVKVMRPKVAPYIFGVYEALALQRLKRNDDALAVVEIVLADHPHSVEALQTKGTILCALDRHEEALTCYHEAIAIDPAFGSALADAAAVHFKLGRLSESQALYQLAEKAQPANAELLYQYSNLMLSMGLCEKVIQLASKGLAHDPNDPNLNWIKAMGLLMSGNYNDGWLAYEWRWQAKLIPAGQNKPVCSQPMWKGEPVAGKTLWLQAEQGLGDTLQMLRYVPLVAAMGAKVLLDIPQFIIPLCDGLQLNCTLLQPGYEVPEFDYYCPLFSLPLAFKTEISNIPAKVPYLFCDTALQKNWERKLDARAKSRVGLVWSGNSAFLNDEKRSIPLERFSKILKINCEFFSLQKEVRQSDELVLSESAIFDSRHDLHTFSETAALIACMDLVISVDTSVAHLAGAMGKPVWLLLPFSPDWRWMLQRSDSPWYPTARLFRQLEDQSWIGVLERVNEELMQLTLAT